MAKLNTFKKKETVIISEDSLILSGILISDGSSSEDDAPTGSASQNTNFMAMGDDRRFIG